VPIHDRLASVPDLPDWSGHAHAVTVSGRLVFVSGQVGMDSERQVVGVGDVAAQTRQALSNLHAILRALGADWPDVVHFNWYVVDPSGSQAIRHIRDELIRPALGERANPASTLVQVAGLSLPELLVEVEAVVALPE